MVWPLIFRLRKTETVHSPWCAFCFLLVFCTLESPTQAMVKLVIINGVKLTSPFQLLTAQLDHLNNCHILKQMFWFFLSIGWHLTFDVNYTSNLGGKKNGGSHDCIKNVVWLNSGHCVTRTDLRSKPKMTKKIFSLLTISDTNCCRAP